MKKFLVFVSLFFSFLFIDNVYAQDVDGSIYIEQFSQIYQPDVISHGFLTSARKTILDNTINELKNDYDILVNVSNSAINIYYVEKSYNFDLQFYFQKGKLSSNSNKLVFSFGYNLSHDSNIAVIYQKQMNSSHPSSFVQMSKSDVFSAFSGEYNLVTNTATINGDNIIYYNDFNVNFMSGTRQFSSYDFKAISNLQLCNSDNCDTTLILNDKIINAPFTFVNDSSINYSDLNRVIKYDDNFYGFFNNYLVINNIFDDGNSVLGSAINCVDNEEDLSLVDNSRLFSNGYCFFDKTDKNVNINDVQFLDTYFAFSNLVGDSSVNFLNDNYYYLYNFRLLKPFTPNLTHLILDTSTGSFRVPISNIYKYDGGSYVDYVVKFYLDFDSYSELNSSSVLKAISIAFDDKVNNYYTSYNDFDGFSVFRSFKLEWFDSNPTTTQLNEFYSNEDLSKIDGVNRTSNFFTDTSFNTFGFSGIVTAPFRFLYALESYNSCSPIVLPFPHSNKNITLACVSDIVPNSINPLIIVLQTILSGIICYYIGVNTLATIKEILTPDKDSVEVVNL